MQSLQMVKIYPKIAVEQCRRGCSDNKGFKKRTYSLPDRKQLAYKTPVTPGSYASSGTLAPLP